MPFRSREELQICCDGQAWLFAVWSESAPRRAALSRQTPPSFEVFAGVRIEKNTLCRGFRCRYRIISGCCALVGALSQGICGWDERLTVDGSKVECRWLRTEICSRTGKDATAVVLRALFTAPSYYGARAHE